MNFLKSIRVRSTQRVSQHRHAIWESSARCDENALRHVPLITHASRTLVVFFESMAEAAKEGKRRSGTS